MRAPVSSHLLHRITATMQEPATIARGEELRELRRAAAAEFGAPRGWCLARTPFGPSVLVRGLVSLSRDDLMWPCELVDHPFYFRGAARRAIAVASHLYGVPADLVEQAAALGLAVEVLNPAVSWYLPGDTTPTVLTRLDGHVAR